MANEEHLAILGQGLEVWNRWRLEHIEIMPDLTGANLSKADLSNADLISADLTGANLSRARLFFTRLLYANLSHADLRDADLSSADLGSANLSGADLSDADLRSADLAGADLSGMILSRASIGWTKFADNDLSTVEGLATVEFLGPSTIGIDTIYKSGGKIPESFLRGCGVPDDFITFIPSIIGARQAIQFYSCFISYSTRDEEFARKLRSRMRDEHLRVWFAPEDVKGGEKLHEQIERAIQLHDRLLIVLSEHSMQSEWVMTELRKARKAERKENRRKLFPISLTRYEAIREWECFDADSGKDLAVEVREYFIPDFSNWKEHDSFEAGFKRLLKDLRAAEA